MLELAARLRGLPREQLAAALQTRDFDPVGIRDLFDLAEALLSSDSVDQAISRLDRPRLAVLAAAAGIVGADAGTTVDEVRTELVRLGASGELSDAAGDLLDALSNNLLVVEAGDRVHVPSAVASRLTSRSGHEIPSAAELAAPAPPVLVAFDEIDRSILERRAAETAYATVAATAELIAELGTQPARELAKGGLALPDSKRLAEASGTELDALPRLFHRADEAGLVVRDGAFWLESDLGAAWALETAAGRWRRLAECWRDRIPPALRDLVARRSETLSASTFRDDVRWFYPAGGRWLSDGVERLVDDAEALGLAVAGEPVEAGRLVLAGELDRAAAQLAAHFPKQVDRVYVQHDLSIVSPGPLEPALDARLRTFADVEGRDLASTYRVSAASVNRGLAAGESAESILSFLGALSLTGIPQPLEYLVAEAAARFGSVRVAAADESEGPARASIRSDDEQIIRTLSVDQSLASIGLRQAGPNRLLSRFTPDVVFWALSDARYPVAAEDADGRIVRLRRHRLAHAPAPAPKTDPIAALLDRVLEQGDEGATELAWLARQLEAAARAKETLTVTVRMPGGQTADYLLAPASVANGRLRARDRKADIERTLPLSAIAAVTPGPVDA
ncbi:helicase-associated domain-containing protein [Agromyces sp. ISL-38]|uniref:helicase-associated domain-containing protein n=1 Tax=Agromyces sp. ISL-38 TaxID=2819107 RepID=UPI001BE9AC0B|nr:helicase-associated domain-containing protein [Agromyces sp. ISL-38]MBT2498112.1 helicase-associated domain-containing protein [Agromyces sp. ISL-38]MBT2518738.1 helicase-associated domain-containing protein [Streptomyces sp. ISL-90]